jgi:hypothetical protein
VRETLVEKGFLNRWLLGAGFAWALLTLTSCHTPLHPSYGSLSYPMTGDVERNYERQANAENEFDFDFAISTHNEQGDFYPVTWLSNVQRASGPFWERVEQYSADKGEKAMQNMIGRTAQKYGYSLLMATSDARRVLGDDLFTAFLHHAATSKQTKAFQYIYAGPGNALVQTGSIFATSLP